MLTREGIHFVFVGDDDDGFSLFIQSGQELHDLDSGLAIEGSCRLVGEYDGWIGDECSGYGYALLLSSGHLVRKIIDLLSQADLGERFYCTLFSLGFSDSLVDEGHDHLMQGTRSREQVIALEYEADILTAYESLIIVCESGYIMSIEDVVSCTRVIEHPYDVHEGRFSASRLAHDRDEFPVVYLDIESLQNLQLLVSEMI